METPFQQDSNRSFPIHFNITTAIAATPSQPVMGFSSNSTLFGNPSITSDQSVSNNLFSTSNELQDTTEAALSSLWIGNIFDAMSLNDDNHKQNVSCTCVEGFKAGFFCQDCNEHLCQKCVVAHYRVNLTKMHYIVKVEDKNECNYSQNNLSISLPSLLPPFSDTSSNNCKQHPNDLASFFCETCSYVICSLCTLNDHKEHRFQFLDNAVESHKSTLRAMIATAKSNVQMLEGTLGEVRRTIDRVVNKSQMVQSEIRSVIQKHIRALQQREMELISKVDQVKTFKCQLLRAQGDELQCNVNKLQAAIDSVNDAANVGEGLQILKAKEKLQSDIASCHDSGYVAEDDGILFIQPDNSMLLGIRSLGDVKSSVCAQQSILCKDSGPSGTAMCGTTVLFAILARDHSGALLHTKPEAFDAIVKKPDNSVSAVDIHDSGGGRYVFNLYVPVEGEYSVSVHCRGVPIRDSPYVLKAKYSVNYKSRSNRGGAPVLVFGKEGDNPGDLCRPWGICCDSQGFLIVADRSNNRVQIFNPDGTFLHMFGSPGTRHGQFDRPAGVAVDNKGHIVVVDKDNHRVQIFRFDGTFVSCFGEKGSKHGQFNYPWDVDVNKVGVIAVSDTRNHRVQLFSFDGAFLSKYGFEGAMWKHFDSPRGVAFTHDNRLIVTDFNNHRLVIINPDMKSARYLGSEGSQTSQFLRPQGVAVDEEGNMVVADSRNHRLQVFTSSGSLIAVFGGGSLEEGCPIQLDRPSGVAVTPDGHIAVVDFGNNRIVLF